MRPYKTIKQIGVYLPLKEEQTIRELYCVNKMSCEQIKAYLKALTGYSVSTRSLQRYVKKIGISRTVKQSYHNAINTGRMKWKNGIYSKRKDYTNPQRRYEMLERDGHRCTSCGNTAEQSILVVDRIVPIGKGGDSSLENIRTICQQCEIGKYRTKKKEA